MKKLAVAATLAAVLYPLTVSATTVTVPDDYSTIPAAIASGADIIMVRDGDYPDPITIPRTLSILPATVSGFFGSLAYPSVGPITIQGSLTGPVTIRHLRIKGAASWNSSEGQVTFDGCRLDLGLTTSGSPFSSVQLYGCIVRGNVNLPLYYPEVVGCTFLQSSLVVQSNGSAYIRDNYFVGPAPVAIQMGSSEATWNVSNNLIVGTTVGIRARAGTAWNNEIRDVTGTALLGDGTQGAAQFLDNLVIHPGGYGIDVVTPQFGVIGRQVRGNRVEDAGLDGIRAGDGGAWIVRSNVVLRAGGKGIVVGTGGVANFNTVISAGGEGLVATSPVTVDSNVVGRSANRGIVVDATGPSLVMRYNTSYVNGGNGIAVSGTGGFALNHNIGFANVGYGLHWTGTGQPTLGCNDWFANIVGGSNVTPGATDLAVNPMFCNVPGDDVHLAIGSPLVNAPGCGQIGALGSGCIGPVSVGPADAAPLLGAYPQPARALLSFSFPPESETRRLAVYDVSGALRWSAQVPSGAGGLEWNGHDVEGHALPAGVYFARMSGTRGEQKTRVVLVH